MQYTLDSQLIVWIVSQLKARLNTVSMRQDEANIGFFKTKGIVEKIRIVRISRSCLKQSEGER